MSMIRKVRLRPWLFALGILAACLAGLLLLPYPRQLLFGPTIRGRPWCVWEAEVRHFVHKDKYNNTPMARVMRWLGVAPRDWVEHELFGDAGMTPLLVHLLDDDDPEVRRQVLRAFRHNFDLDARQALPALYRLLADDHADQRVEAARLIVLLNKDRMVLPILFRELEGDDSKVDRSEIVRILAWHMADAGPEVLLHLAGRLGDKYQPVRFDLMRAMEKFGAQGQPILMKGLADPDQYVRLQAAEYLLRIGHQPPEAAKVLEEMLTNAKEYRGVRLQAVEMLTRMGRKPEAALPLLTEILTDPSPVSDEERLEAIRIVRLFGADARPLLPTLEKLLQAPPMDGRETILAALLAIDPQRYQHLRPAPSRDDEK